MSQVIIHYDDVTVGEILRVPHTRSERVSFRYSEEWLLDSGRFSFDPELYLDVRTSVPGRGILFGAFSDCAPDRWGRQLMQRAERRRAEKESRPARRLSELDFVLGVSDISRLGALRFMEDGVFQAPGDSVPPLVKLGALKQAAMRVERNEETDEDLQLIFAPGSSLGGARPKASVRDQKGRLSIAKFPRQDDEYDLSRWEHIALLLARKAGIRAADSDLPSVDGKGVLLSRRFDREGDRRIHFASALTLLGLQDGERASYPEIADILQREGCRPKADSAELFRRMVLNICLNNVDDHLRNHGFLRESGGWRLSPAFDINPVPTDLQPRILATNISLDDATASLELAREVASYFGLSKADCEENIGIVIKAVSSWRQVARSEGASPSEITRMRSAFEP